MPFDAETFAIARSNLSHQGIRTYLTLLGVIIGIAAIVALVSISEGLNQNITEQFESLGTNTIFVMAGSQSMTSDSHVSGKVQGMTENDIKRIQRLSGVKEAIPIYSATATIKRGAEQKTVAILAADPAAGNLFEDTGYFDVGEGRAFQKNDSFSIVIGYNVAKNNFQREIAVKNSIEIEGKKFKVIGITKETAASLGGGNTSDVILMPKSSFMEAFPDTDPVIMFVKSTSTDNVNEVSDRIKRYFEKKYGEDKFTVMSSQQAQESVQAVIGIISLFLIAIAMISLVVGGIGIMNSMLMSVMERTKEIGVMKAIGATNSTILSLILIEAGLIGLVGGIIGIVLGFSGSLLISVIANAVGFSLNVALTPMLVIGTLFFAMAVGMASGYYPAKRAATMDPVIALRFE